MDRRDLLASKFAHVGDRRALLDQKSLAVLEVGQAEIDLLGALRRLGQGRRDDVSPALLQGRNARIARVRAGKVTAFGSSSQRLGELAHHVDVEAGPPTVLAIERERLERDLNDRGEAVALEEPDRFESCLRSSPPPVRSARRPAPGFRLCLARPIASLRAFARRWRRLPSGLRRGRAPPSVTLAASSSTRSAASSVAAPAPRPPPVAATVAVAVSSTDSVARRCPPRPLPRPPRSPARSRPPSPRRLGQPRWRWLRRSSTAQRPRWLPRLPVPPLRRPGPGPRLGARSAVADRPGSAGEVSGSVVSTRPGPAATGAVTAMADSGQRRGVVPVGDGDRDLVVAGIRGRVVGDRGGAVALDLAGTAVHWKS